jgi:hypothetical protein
MKVLIIVALFIGLTTYCLTQCMISPQRALSIIQTFGGK